MALKGKRALITGSSRGIGRGIALRLAQEGVKVAVHYYKNKDAATDTLAKVRERGADGFAVQADVSRPEEIRRMFKQVQGALGGLDIFVTNARPDLGIVPLAVELCCVAAVQVHVTQRPFFDQHC